MDSRHDPSVSGLYHAISFQIAGIAVALLANSANFALILFADTKESLNFSISGVSYAKDVQSASLIICVNNGTTFIECLSESKPAILVLNERQWLFREQAGDIISELLGVGLMHFDAKGAAQFCNKVDLVSWGQRDDVALVRSNFLFRFGRKLDSVSGNLSNVLSEL